MEYYLNAAYFLYAAIQISVRRKSSPAHGPRTKQEKMRYGDLEFTVLDIVRLSRKCKNIINETALSTFLLFI